MSYTAKRKCMRADITRMYNKLQQDPVDLSLLECQSQLTRLEKLQEDIKSIDDECLEEASTASNATDKSISDEYNGITDYQVRLYTCLNLLEALVNPPVQQTVENDLPENLVVPERLSSNRLKLPQIPLPTYAHKDGENLAKFFQNFEHIMGKYNLTDYEKFVFLQGQLSGEPLNLVKSLDISSQSYDAAKELLTNAFASIVTQQFDCIKRLSELKFSPKTPYEFIGKLRQIRESFRVLEVTPDIIMQFYFWRSMPELLQNQFVAITNANRPSLAQIDAAMFSAMERYLDLNTKAHNQQSDLEVSSYIVNMDQYKSKDKGSGQYCSLCSTSNEKTTTHSTYACSVYPSTKDKLNRLRTLSGCTSCGNVTHASKDCRFKFKRMCVHCSKPHFSFLCEGQGENKNENIASESTGVKPKNYKQKIDAHVHASCVWVNEARFDDIGHDSMLPTLTFKVQDTTVRAIRDSGSQTSFITESMANKLKLKVVKPHFKLGVHGFNSSRKINTRVVELPVAKSHEPIWAVCVPEIRTNLILPGLGKIVKAFKIRGYSFADAKLDEYTDIVSGIDVILGNNEAQIIPQTDIPFGNAPKSAYADTPMGIMVFGSIERMTSNLIHLPALNSYTHVERSGKIRECIPKNDDVHVTSLHVEHQFDLIDSKGNVNHETLGQALKSASKLINFPNGRVKEAAFNKLDEVTDAIITKGNRETVNQYVKSLVFLLKASEVIADTPLVPDLTSSSTEDGSVRPKRKKAKKCKNRMQKLAKLDLA